MVADWLSICNWSHHHSYWWHYQGYWSLCHGDVAKKCSRRRTQYIFHYKISECVVKIFLGKDKQLHIGVGGKQAVRVISGFQITPEGPTDAVCSAWMVKVRALSVKQVKHCHNASVCGSVYISLHVSSASESITAASTLYMRLHSTGSLSKFYWSP